MLSLDGTLSLDGDHYFVAGSSEIGQAHGNGISRRDAVRHKNVDLIEAGIPRGAFMPPVGVNAPVEGSNSSAVANGEPNAAGPEPPVIKTLPEGSSVAVCPARGVVMELAGVNVPVDCAAADPSVTHRRTTRRTMTARFELFGSATDMPTQCARIVRRNKFGSVGRVFHTLAPD
jgi:hypothetical protein